MKTLGPAPGSRKYPEHRVDIAPADGRFRVVLNGTEIARSERTLAVDETNYPRVIYFPPEDVQTGLLESSSSRTTCPFKGEASYLAAELDGEITDIAWSYPAVYDEVAPLAGYIAFYADRVELDREDPNSAPDSINA